MGQLIYKPVPKRDCVYIADIIKAAYLAGVINELSVTMTEAADAFTASYSGEMVFDGSSNGLAKPYLEECTPGNNPNGYLSNKHASLVDYFDDWWSTRQVYQDPEFATVGDRQMILESDFRLIWERMCNILFGGEFKDDYLKCINDVKDKQRSTELSVKLRPDEKSSLNVASADKVEIKISSQTHDRLLRAIDAFPSRYPEYAVRLPKLDTDVRPWLEEVGLAANKREAHVFGVIIAEHFNISPDTQKSHE